MTIGFGTTPKGVRIGTPSTATVTIEEPCMPMVAMSPSPGTISENGGVSAWLGYPTEYEVTVRVVTGDSSSTDDFTLSEKPDADDPGRLEVWHGDGDAHGGGRLRAQPDEGLVGARVADGAARNNGGQCAESVHRRRRSPGSDPEADPRFDPRRTAASVR